MKCTTCKNNVIIDDFFYGSIIKNYDRKESYFFCASCTQNQPERLKRSDAEMQSESPNLAEMQGDMQK